MRRTRRGSNCTLRGQACEIRLRMSNPTEHPIATPKSAAAVSIVLAVLGVFTPFIVDLKAALGFAVLCSAIIVWLYLADIGRSVTTKSFGTSLLVPLLSIIAISGMAIFSINGKSRCLRRRQHWATPTSRGNWTNGSRNTKTQPRKQIGRRLRVPSSSSFLRWLKSGSQDRHRPIRPPRAKCLIRFGI